MSLGSIDGSAEGTSPSGFGEMNSLSNVKPLSFDCCSLDLVCCERIGLESPPSCTFWHVFATIDEVFWFEIELRDIGGLDEALSS